MSDILQAARSYYGLPDTGNDKTELYTNDRGQVVAVFEVPISPEDFIAIGARMQNMQQLDTQPDTAIIEGPTVEAMREAYNALSKAEKGRYGSFARYMADVSDLIVEVNQSWGPTPVAMPRSSLNTEAHARQVVHVDAPEEPEPVSMDAIWVDGNHLTSSQRGMAIDNDGRFYLMNASMLTDEQKQKAKESGK